MIAFAMIACSSGTLNAGWDKPKGKLPVDNRNPVVLCNDGANDNWFGEYASLFASAGTLTLAGLVISTGPNDSTDLEDNMANWRSLVAAAKQSGLRNVPEPLASNGAPLVRPADGNIDSTTPNRSEGATFIVDAANRLAQPFRPLVAMTGGRLTDIADAYLMDHSLPERLVVVSALGTATANGGRMGIPNGELDKWADVIVAQRFQYVQVSAYYDQMVDVSDALLGQSPSNAFTARMQTKQSLIYDDVYAADQVAVLAVAIPEFVSAVSRMAQLEVNSNGVPQLTSDASGSVWLVTQIDSSLATARLAEILMEPRTFQIE